MSEDMMSVVEAAVAEHTGAEGSGDESTSGEAPASETTDSAAEGAEAAAASTEPGVDASEAAAKESAAKPSDDDDELKSLEQELVEKTPALKNGKIPVSRHQAVLTRERRKFEAQLKELESKYKPYEDPAFRNRVQAMEIAERDPDRFLQFLTSLPQYRERIDRLVEQRALQVAPAPPPPPAAVDDEKKPEPDRIEPDGSLGYSPEQAEKLAQYYARQAERKAQERIEKLQSEVKPLVEQYKVAALVKEAEVRQGQILNHARKYWEGFQEFDP